MIVSRFVKDDAAIVPAICNVIKAVGFDKAATAWRIGPLLVAIYRAKLLPKKWEKGPASFSKKRGRSLFTIRGQPGADNSVGCALLTAFENLEK